MEKKIAPSMWVLSATLKTSMATLTQNIGDKAKLLAKEAVANEFHISGPQYWVYTWPVFDPNVEFELKICLPVATFGKKYQGSGFILEKLDAFKYVSIEHLGAWEDLGNTYSSFMAQVSALKLTPSMVCREVYYNCDFEQPENNITFIQFGIVE